MIRKIVKKLNNFRFTSVVASIIAFFAGAYSIASFAFFHFAGDTLPREKYLRKVGFYDLKVNGKEIGGQLSFLVFLSCLITLICAIVVIYVSVPYIKNKVKLLPKKSTLITGFIGGVANLGICILMIALIGQDPNTKAGLIATLPVGILSTIGMLLMLFPRIACTFYMPEIKK